MSATRWMALTVLSLCGCAGASHGATPRPVSEQEAMASGDCATGTVGVMGSEGAATTMLRMSGGLPIRLVGDRAMEVRRLTQALVTVCGTRLGDGALSVATFELREVDGMTAYLGTLQGGGDAFVLDPGNGRPLVSLRGVPAELGAKARSRVWVAGAWGRDGFAVSSWGAAEG